MKKQALALGLSLALLSQSIWVPASFAADKPAAPVAQSETGKGYSHSISDEGLDLIKSFEGFLPYPIWDYQQYSIGYGSYVDASTIYKDSKSPTGYSSTLYPGGISEREASELLREMVDDFTVHLNIFLETNKISLNQNQFDALTSFTYNLGKYVWTAKNYTFMRMLKSGSFRTNRTSFIEAYTSICHAGGSFNQGLYDRRVREVEVFYAEESLSDPNADLYVVNASSLYVRSAPTAGSPIKGSLARSQVIRVHRYSDDKLWAYTSFCGYFGWVSTDYLIRVNEASLVTEVDDNGKDAQGIRYTFNGSEMTAAVGSSAASNSSGYSGAYAGEVFLTKTLLYKGKVYTLTSISDTAFTDCKTIESIYIPPCVTSIGDNAFKNSSLKQILYTSDSTAEEWAKANAVPATDYRCRAGHLTASWRTVQAVTDDTLQVEQRSCSVCGETETRSYDHIEIVTFPNKIEYKQDDKLKTDGLALEIVYTDGTRVPAPSFKVVDGDTAELGNRTVTVQYSTMTTKFDVLVSEKALTSITVSKKPKKLTYLEGAALVTDGLAVTANYDNGTTSAVKEYSVSGYDPNKVGKQKVTVSYNGFSTTFEVNVKAKSLTAFTFSSYPDKLEYFCGESFSSAGMVLKLTYDNGTVEYANKGFKISGYDKNRAGTQKVKVTYGGISQNIQVVVILNYLKSDKYTPKNGKLTVTEEQLTVSKLVSEFYSNDRVEVIKDGKVLPGDSTVGTGMTIRIKYNTEVQDKATIVVAGDLTGDGKCSVSDFVALSDYFVERAELSAAALAASDINRDGKVDLADYVELYNAVNSEVTAVPLASKSK